MTTDLGKAKILVLALGTLACAGAASVVKGQGAGVFAQEQVTVGEREYLENCAGCHGNSLAGGNDSPSLAGQGFLDSWAKKPVGALFQFLSTTMPVGNEGNLSKETYADITAFLLYANGAKPGTAILTGGSEVGIGTLVTGQTPVEVAKGLTMPPGRTRPPAPVRHGLTVEGVVKDYAPVSQDMLIHPPDGDWLMYRRNYLGWSYSPLDQINAANVNRLQLKWAWAMNEGGASEVTPIVHSGVIFLSNTSNTVQALDARTGELIWENRIGPDATVAYMATRSLALYEDKVFVATTDAKLYALDARTGKVVWHVEIAPPPKGETGGVIVIHGKVLVGMMGCDNYSSVNCHISAYDAETGKPDWTFYTTARQGTPGGDSWNGLLDDQRAGTDTWIAGTYDPELNTTYWGVAQAKPWMRASRRTYGASVLYSNSTLALDPDTGKLKWYFQHVPGESLDLDVAFERVLIDHGREKSLMTIGKDGILWKLDRSSGKFLGETETLFQNVFSKIDPKTGQVTYRPDIVNQKTNQWIASCPGPEGGHDWQATSYNPPTDILLIPLSQSCILMRGHDVELKPGGGGTAASELFYFMPGTHRNMGKLAAFDTSTMKQVWAFQQRSPFLTAVLSTGGRVAFVGDFDRVFKAVDVRTGKILWQVRLGNTVQGYPVAFSLDGKEYVAVMAGLGGGSPEQKPSTLLTEVHRPSTGQQLYVFALPDGN
jgi:PQQ-dependent dehydrogenase (methanol/ethanol family)